MAGSGKLSCVSIGPYMPSLEVNDSPGRNPNMSVHMCSAEAVDKHLRDEELVPCAHLLL